MNRPSLSSLRDQALALMDAKITGADARLRTSNLYVLATVHAGLMHGLWGYLEWIWTNALPDKGAEAALQRWANLLDVPRLEPSAAQLRIAVSGSIGAELEAGTAWQRSDGATYTLSAAVVLSTETQVDVAATETGTAPNAETGVKLTLVTPVPGVEASSTVTSLLRAGKDLENVEEWRQRLLDVMRRPRSTGRTADYVRWAREVSGVTRAWCLPHHAGVGTVGVTFMRDGDESPLPDELQLEDVRQYLAARMMVGVVELVVFAPTIVPLNPRILLTPNRVSTRSSVQSALEKLILAAAAPGGRLYISHIREAISRASGEVDHRLLAPTDDVQMLTGELLTLGAITWE